MGFKFVFLWTDVALWALMAALAAYVLRIRSQATLRASWARVLRDPVSLSASVVMALFLLLTLVDSVHFRRALPSSDVKAAQFYDTRTESLLDLLLARQIAMRETSYSEPLSYRGFNKEALPAAEGSGDAVTRDYPRLQFGGAHLSDPAAQWLGDVLGKTALGLALGLALAALIAALMAAVLARSHGGWTGGLRDLLADRTDYPWRAALLTLSVVALLVGPVLMLMPHYHVFGTDRTGNDVLYQALKSVRTAFVIGALSTLATLPLALGLGVLAGYFKGWVDELIQYLYTTLTSVPNVLLIAACVLMVQVFLDKNPQAFETGAERSDLKMFLLCVILGVTGWAGLCRLVRGETLKLRELDYVQAATAFGVSHGRIMAAPHRAQCDAPGADHRRLEFLGADPLRGGADLCRRRRRPQHDELRRHDQSGPLGDVARPGGLVELRGGLRLHGDPGAGRESVRRRRARRLRSPFAQSAAACAVAGRN